MAKNSILGTLSFDEIATSLKALEANGVTPDHLARLRSDKKFAKAVGWFIVGGRSETAPKPMMAAKKFALQVNYDQSLEAAREAGEYDWTDPDFTSKNFPTTRKGTAHIKLHLVNLGRRTSTEEVIAEMDKRRLRPAGAYELLALGAAYPELQYKFPIVALDSILWDEFSERHVPCLDRHAVGRTVTITILVDIWDAVYYFAAVPKGVFRSLE